MANLIRLPPIPVLLTALLAAYHATAFAPSRVLHHRQSFLSGRNLLKLQDSASEMASEVESPGIFFATNEQTATDAEMQTQILKQQRRQLGSQELLMLPRQYGLSDVQFPQMNHVSCTILSETPRIEHLERAVQDALRAHPLLRARVEGNGEPEKRIDLFQMVRQGEPSPLTFVADEESVIKVADVLTVVNVSGKDRAGLEESWKSSFARDLDDGSWCQVDQGPLWKLELHRIDTADGSRQPCALVLAFNHAISDQSSANRLVDQMLQTIVELEQRSSFTPTRQQEIPVALEDSVMGMGQRWSDVQFGGVSKGTIQYVAAKAAEGFKGPVILPDDRKDKDSSIFGAFSIISGRAAGGHDKESPNRRSTLQFRKLSKETTAALLKKCRENGVSMSNALTASVTLTATDFVGKCNGSKKQRNYKILQSLDMRRFGEQLDKGETVACMAGSMDLMHGPLPDESGKAIRKFPSKSGFDLFWKLAKEGKQQTSDFIKEDGPFQAVRVFDFAMTISDLNNLVHLTGQSKDTEGRAYSAGVTNAGVLERLSSFQREGDNERSLLENRRGRFQVQGVFYATPHTQSGCLYQVSCLTVNDELQLTFHPVSPIVSDETNQKFSDAFVDILETTATEKGLSDAVDKKGLSDGTSKVNVDTILPENALAILAAFVGSTFVLSHGQAWFDFFHSVAQMKAKVDDPADFWAALNFWIFFAVGHPILQPILWISDVLHGSPGPLVGGLVPASFLAGNLLFITAVALSKEVRKASSQS